MQEAISEKAANMAFQISTFVTGFVVAFIKSWDMTLVMVGCLPFLAMAAGLIASFAASMRARSTAAYAEVRCGCIWIWMSCPAVVGLRTWFDSALLQHMNCFRLLQHCASCIDDLFQSCSYQRCYSTNTCTCGVRAGIHDCAADAWQHADGGRQQRARRGGARVWGGLGQDTEGEVAGPDCWC